MTTLRPYQEKALAEIRKHYASGCKKVLLHLATGGGKTLIFSQILKSASAKGTRSIMVVKGKELIDQCSQRLFREGVDHGCLQGTHWNYKPDALVQICSVDTLYRRKLAPKADLCVIDECHLATSDSFKWVIDQYPNAYFLPVSATPHHKKGLRHIADNVVYPITIKDLMNEGYLSRPIYYAPTKLDLTNVKIDSSTSDYNVKQSAEAVGKVAVYGEIVTYYKKICGDQSAILFAVNIAHSLEMVERFKAAGISAEHVEADTPKWQRDEVISRLVSGETKVVCNVGILTTGVDVPSLRAVILARPTKSYNLMIQMCGRGTRTTPDKNRFYILDHANNIDEHGFIEDERLCDLDGLNKDKKEKKPSIVTCKECYAVFEYDFNDPHCPECGTKYQGQAPIRSRKEAPNVALVEIKYKERSGPEIELDKWIKTANARGYKPGWVYHKVSDKYGKPQADAVWQHIKKLVKVRDRQTQLAAITNSGCFIETEPRGFLVESNRRGDDTEW